MPQPADSTYYNGMYYEIGESPFEPGVWLWVVYDIAGRQMTSGTADSSAIAWQLVEDFIDAASGEEGDIGPAPWDEPEVAVGEEASFSNDYSGYDCVSQTVSWKQDFITVSGTSTPFSQDTTKPGDVLTFDSASSLHMTMPSLHKMKLQMTIRARHAGLQESLPYSENVNIALEGGDSLEVVHDGNDIFLSLIQDGREVISNSQLGEVNEGYLTKSVTVKMQFYQVCTLKEEVVENGNGNGNGNGGGEEGDGLSQDDLWMILGLVVLTLLVGYVFSTTPEGN